jgi:uncharacterized membrane protein YtjA (UPF0391 family)
MLRLSFVFLAIALIAGCIDFAANQENAWGGTRYIAALFFVLALACFMGALRSRSVRA